MALLLDKYMSQLSPFLVKDAGINSGFMIDQATAVALASEMAYAYIMEKLTVGNNA